MLTVNLFSIILFSTVNLAAARTFSSTNAFFTSFGTVLIKSSFRKRKRAENNFTVKLIMNIFWGKV